MQNVRVYHQQQQSFCIMLSCAKDKFTGRLSCVYDRPYRLIGCWEATLISFSHTTVPVYILCDLMDYSEINQCKVQLLDHFYSSHGMKSEGRTQYVKVLHKRFNTINIDMKIELDKTPTPEQLKALFSESYIKGEDAEREITCLLHFRRVG